MTSALPYCGQLVREQDPDRFLISLFAPPDRHEALWALFAFNYEIAKTREVVSETALGLARLQWWREAIGKIYDNGDILKHEILTALAPAIRTYDLAREDFDTLIYAREFDLEDVLPSNMDGFLHYADFTGTPLMRLAAKIAGADDEMEPIEAVAINYAIAGLLRAVPFHAHERRCYLPEDLMKQHGVTLRQLHDFLKPEPGLKDVVRSVAGHFVYKVKPQDRMLKAAQRLAEIYMRQLARNHYDPFANRMKLTPYFKALRVSLAAA